jgi:hypothetical protein
MAIDGVLVPIVMFSMIPVVAIGVPIARAFARRLESKPTASIPHDVAARLERMEQAIDSIAVEVERISEGQRFTTRLLAERVPPPGPSALPDQR